MATLSAQIQSLAGSVTESEIDQWCVDGVRELTNLFPPHLKEYCYSKQTFTSAAANSEAETMITGELGSVYAGSVECRQIRPMDKHKASSSTSIEYATATAPVYYVEGNKLNILPASSSGVYYVIADPSIDANAVSAISNFPNEAEYLVVLYASIKALQNKMNEKSSDLPSDISDVVLSVVSTSLPTYTAPSVFVMPASPSGADVNFADIGSVETFVSPVFTAPTLGTITSMSLPTPPVTPSMSEKSVTITGTAPTYTQPVLSLESEPTLTEPTYIQPVLSLETAPVISDISINVAIPVAPTLDSTSVDTSGLTNPIFTAPVMSPPDWADTEDLITSEEDSEMLGARVTEINAKIGEYSNRLQESQAQFNKENSILQKDLQIAMQNASTFEQGKLAKYSSELQSYQAQVNSEIQEWQLNMQKDMSLWETKNQTYLQRYQADLQNNLNTFNKENAVYQADMQVWVTKSQSDLQKYQSDIQNNLNIFNKEQTEYQAKLQKDLQDAQLAESKEGRDLQKYSSELRSYQAQVSTEVQKWTNETFGKAFQEWTQKYQGQLQEYGTDLQKETARVQSSLADYQAKVNKALQTYQAETGYDLSKYQAEVQAQVQKYQSDLQQNTTTFTNELQKYTSEIQKVNSDNQNVLAKQGQDLANYSAKIQKHSTDYQWLQGQYAQLKQDYNQGIQLLIGGQASPQQGGQG